MPARSLNELSTKNETWTIQVNVLIHWDAIKLLTNELNSTDMILLDKKVQLLLLYIISLVSMFQS
jgi:hypothetical protein